MTRSTPTRPSGARSRAVLATALLIAVAGLLGLGQVGASASTSESARAAASGAESEGASTAQGRMEVNPALLRLRNSAEKQAAILASDAWRLPIPRGVYRLTARFGQCSGLWAHCHTGLDFAAPTGTVITAVAGGTVTSTGGAGAYGNRTIVTLEDGTELWYCHQSAYGVKPGQTVIPGGLIGYVGSTGNTTGPHLHLEVRPGAGDPVDPYQALIAHGVTP